MMKNKDEKQFESLLTESIKKNIKLSPPPLKTKEEAWSEISKHLPEQQKPKLQMSWRFVAALVVILSLGMTFFHPSSSTAFGWIKEFFMFQEGSTLYTSSGAKPGDSPPDTQAPPSPEEIFVLEGENQSYIVSFKEAVELANFKLAVPTYLPDGYREQEANVHCYNDHCNNILLVYVNEEAQLLMVQQTFFEGPYGTGSTYTNVIETKEISVNGARATMIITSRDDYKILTWEKNNKEYQLSGFLSEEDIVAIAKSMK